MAVLQPIIPLHNLYSTPYLALLSLGSLFCKMEVKYVCKSASTLLSLCSVLKGNPREEEEEWDVERKAGREKKENRQKWRKRWGGWGRRKKKETPTRNGILQRTAHAQFRKCTKWKCKLENLFSLHCCRPHSIWSH